MPALAAVQSSYAFVSRAHLEQAIQRELAALAAIEAVRRSACRWLEEWSGPERVKEHLACHIEARHQTEREPHLLRLADLHQQRIAVTKSPRWPTRAAACAMVRSQGWVQISEPHEYQRIIRTRHRDGTDLGLPRGRGLCR
jgi:hypothetical protein